MNQAAQVSITQTTIECCNRMTVQINSMASRRLGLVNLDETRADAFIPWH